MRHQRSAASYAAHDARPRLHLWPQQSRGFRWSLGPSATRSLGSYDTAGAALDAALEQLAQPALTGAVVILEGRHA